MAATHRLKGIGWFAVLAGAVLAWYLVSLQGAAERRKLDEMNARIAAAQRDIRALETEFDTRANLVQLERWNGDTLALAAPVAAQFVADDAALATLDPNAAPDGVQVRTAALVVPALASPPVASPSPLPTSKPAPQPALAPAPMPAGPVRMASVGAHRPASLLDEVTAPRRTGRPASLMAEVVAPSGRNAPAMARAAEQARGAVAVARVRPQAVALLDRKLLSDNTFGDLMSGARREARR